jgi:HEAT repeat protein
LLGLLDRPLVYGDAVGALVKLGDERALEPLIKLFVRKPQPDFATVLGNWGDRRAVPALIAAMQNPDKHVRYYTARALGKLGDERALPVLKNAVENDTEKFTDTWPLRDKSVAIAAAKAIAAIEGGG